MITNNRRNPNRPHKILNIGTPFTKSDLKKAYLKAALQHHPDRGGDSQVFQKVSVAYAVLTKQLETSGYKDHNELKQSLKQSGEQLTTKIITLINKFNKLYKKTRWIFTRKEVGWKILKVDIPTYKGFICHIPNSQFEAMKQSQTNFQATCLQDPQNKFYKGWFIMELGKEKVKNFSGESGGLKYRDLKDAYENPTMIYKVSICRND